MSEAQKSETPLPGRDDREPGNNPPGQTGEIGPEGNTRRGDTRSGRVGERRGFYTVHEDLDVLKQVLVGRRTFWTVRYWE